MIPDPALDLGYEVLELVVAGREVAVRSLILLEVHHQYLVLWSTDSFDGAEEVIRLRLAWRAQEEVVYPHDKPFRLSTAEKLLESGRDVCVAVAVRTFRSLDYAELIPFRPGSLEVQPALILRVNVDPEDGLLFTHCLPLLVAVTGWSSVRDGRSISVAAGSMRPQNPLRPGVCERRVPIRVKYRRTFIR